MSRAFQIGLERPPGSQYGVSFNDLPFLSRSHGVCRTGELEVVEAAGSNGESSRGGKGRGVLPGGGGALALGGGIALSSIIR